MYISNYNSKQSSHKIFSTFGLLIALLYLAIILVAPIVDNTFYKVQNFTLTANNNKNFAFIHYKQIYSAKGEITVTYINNGKFIARQIDNNSLQNYVNDAHGSVLKLNNFDGANLITYKYDAYGNIINNGAVNINAKYAKTAHDNIALSRTMKRDEQKIELAALKLAYDENKNRNNKTRILNNEIQMIDSEITLLNDENKFIKNNLVLKNIAEANGIPNQFMYNGERFDNNTNLQYLRARFYSPEVKRFVNQDTYEFLNRFSYVDNNPISKTDPSGHVAIHEVIGNWFNNAEEDCNWAKITGSGLGAALTSVGLYKSGARAATWYYNAKIAKQATALSQQLKDKNFASQFANGDSNTYRRANAYDGIVIYQTKSSGKKTSTGIGIKMLRKINLAPAHGAVGFGMVSEDDIANLSGSGVLEKIISPSNNSNSGKGYFKMDFVFKGGNFNVDGGPYTPKHDKIIYFDYSGARGLNREIAGRAILSLARRTNVMELNGQKTLSYGLYSTNCQYYLNRHFLPEYIAQAESALSLLNQ